MTSRTLRLAAVSVLTCMFVLTGCSKPASTTPGDTGGTSSTTAGGSTATGSTATGSTATGDGVAGKSGGFSVVPPEGWAEATDRATGVTGLELVLLSSKKVDGFSNNLVVVAVEGDESALRNELDKGKQQMAAAGRTVADLPDLAVAGATGHGFSTAFKQQGIPVVARSYALHHGSMNYLLTLSSSQADADHALSELGEMTSTWVWK